MNKTLFDRLAKCGTDATLAHSNNPAIEAARKIAKLHDHYRQIEASPLVVLAAKKALSSPSETAHILSAVIDTDPTWVEWQDPSNPHRSWGVAVSPTDNTGELEVLLFTEIERCIGAHPITCLFTPSRARADQGGERAPLTRIENSIRLFAPPWHDGFLDRAEYSQIVTYFCNALLILFFHKAFDGAVTSRWTTLGRANVTHASANIS